jgi:hypothetical protein
MNKLIALAFWMIIFSGIASAATLIINDTFEDVAITNAFWDVNTGTETNTESRSPSNSYLLDAQNEELANTSISFTGGTTPAVLGFWVKASATDNAETHQIWFEDNSDQRIINSHFDNDWEVYDGVSAYEAITGSMLQTVWQYYEVHYYAINGSCDFLINGTKTYQMDRCYHDAQVGLDEIRIYKGSAGDKSIYLDDVAICDGICPPLTTSTPGVFINVTSPTEGEYVLGEVFVDAHSTQNVTCNINDSRYTLYSNNDTHYTWNTTTLSNNYYSIMVNCSNVTAGQHNNVTRNFYVTSYSIDNCTSNTNLTAVFNTRNLSTNAFINSTSSFFFQYNNTGSRGATIYNNFSMTDSNYTYKFCINPGYASVTSDLWIDYTVSGTTYNYFLDDVVFNNASQTYNLYTQDSTSTIRFRVTEYVGNDPVAGAFIKVLKFDVGGGVYKTTEILKTDTEGYALGNIVLEHDWYKFIIVYDGIARLTTEPEKFPITATTRNFRISLDTTWYDNFDTSRGVEHILAFNNVTNNFRFTFNDPSGAMHKACLKVNKINVSNNVVVGDNCTISTAGTILVNIGAPGTNFNGTTYIATSYLVFDDVIVLDVLEQIFRGVHNLFSLKGGRGKSIGFFTSFMLVTTLITVGMFSPMIAILLGVVGVLFSVIIGMYQLTISTIIVMFLLAGLLIWKLSRR